MKSKNDTVLSEKIILSLSFFSACCYWFHCENPSGSAILAKTMSTALLAIHSYKVTSSHLANPVALTMSLHCTGDLLIELSDDFILLALAAFFFGHSGYFLLLQKNKLPNSKVSLLKKTGLSVFAMIATAFTSLLINKKSGAIQYAIPFYSLALSSMFVTAALQKRNSKRVMLGATFYVISDLLIAINLFLQKIPGISYLTWPLYFSAQNLLRASYHDTTNMIHMPATSAAPCCPK